MSHPRKQEPFFSASDRSAFWIATAASFAVYFATLAPTVTLEDSGELAVAADYLGVPHPPGYPIWTILAWIFHAVFAFVPFRGHPNPAWAVGLLSVVAGALATGLLALLTCRSGRDLLANLREEKRPVAHETLICLVGSVTGALLFAFSPAMWSQSVIIEVYSLNALFMMGILVLTYRWLVRPTNAALIATALLFGLGLTNYQILLLIGATLAVAVLLRDLDLFRDFVLAAVALGMLVLICRVASTAPIYGFAKHGAASMPISGGAATVLASAIAGLGLLAHAFRVRRATGLLVLFGVGCVLVLVFVMRLDPPPEYVAPHNVAVEPFNWRTPIGVFFAMAAIMLLMAIRMPRGFAFPAACLATLVPLAVLTRKGILHGLVHPTSPWFWMYFFLNGVLLIYIACLLPRGRVVALTILAFEAGLAVYGYMPLVSDLLNPPMNWGHALTWEGFKHSVTRSQYHSIEPTSPLSEAYVEQVIFYLWDLRRQFTMLIVPLGFLPFCMWRYTKLRLPLLATGCVAAIAIGLCAVVEKSTSGVPAIASGGVYRALFVLAMLIAAIGVALLLTSAARDLFAKLRDHTASHRVVSGLILTAFALAYLLFVAHVVRTVAGSGAALPPMRALILGFIALAPAAVIGGLIFLRRSEGGPTPQLDIRSQQWLLALLAGFMALSLLLISLAQLKGDLQDTFIQRVKFIPSHLIFAVWLAYGVMIMLTVGTRLLSAIPRIGILAPLLACLLPLVPISQNIWNRSLVFEMGGAEQGDHDFGWQFGYYQLRGSVGIEEELTPDAEPLPNPQYPPPLEQDAILFGGTDPGRFVPTYMIFSANVRPDVFLLTQNALADNSYMSVLRDLYGQDIWLPTLRDNRAALGRYVAERRDRINKAQGLQVSGGRIFVQGPREVMKINEFITRMIFDKNKWRHAFYVEESFPIPWMNDFMVPHGLIMRVDERPHDKLPTARVNEDMDFWDWYARRLSSDRRFVRDVSARKAFSKLRTTMGGIYAHHEMYDLAETAYREALLLYPASPEGTFRLLRDVYWKSNRLADAKPTLLRFAQIDPLNDRIQKILKSMDQIFTFTDRKELIHDQITSGNFSPDQIIKVADQYHERENPQGVAILIDGLLGRSNLNSTELYRIGKKCKSYGLHARMETAFTRYIAMAGENLSDVVLLEMAQIYREAGNITRRIEVLNQFLTKHPAHTPARIDLAVALFITKRYDQGVSSLQEAIRLGGDKARRAIQSDPRLAPVLQHDQYRKLLE